MKRAISVELHQAFEQRSETEFAEAEARYRGSVIAQRQAEGWATLDPEDDCVMPDPSNPDGGLTRVFWDKNLRANVIVKTFRCCRCAKRWYNRRDLCCWNVFCSRCGATCTLPAEVAADLPACCTEPKQQFHRRLEIE